MHSFSILSISVAISEQYFLAAIPCCSDSDWLVYIKAEEEIKLMKLCYNVGYLAVLLLLDSITTAYRANGTSRGSAPSPDSYRYLPEMNL
jgi:hypothetical protein